jgi:glutamate carboxypeptidase
MRIFISKKSFVSILALVIILGMQSLPAQQLNRTEKKIIQAVERNHGEALDFLERVVNINSGTFHLEGVKEVGVLFDEAFASLGFETTWKEMPEEMNRAGHLVCEHSEGTAKGKRLLLLGHFDTVFEKDSPFQVLTKDGDTWYGPGVNDMKGGDVIMLYALRALKESGALKDSQIIVIYTGDEEDVGQPLELSRKDLVDAAKRSDVALGFEGATGLEFATVARRSAGTWLLETKGKRAHSSGIFREDNGAGAIFEMSRILNAFYTELQEENLTFNPGAILGGTTAEFEEMTASGEAFGKTNVVAPIAYASGDIRCLTEEQIQKTVGRMKEITERNLPQTSASISFSLLYPPMAPTDGNYEVLEVLDGVSQDLGQGKVSAYDPSRRGAGDISFVAKYVDALDGLGTMGGRSHTPEEYLEVQHFQDLTKRAALLIYRLIHP